MNSAIKNLKLNSDITIAMFDRVNRLINVYFKNASGKPVRTETKRGDGWTILFQIAKQSNTTTDDLINNYSSKIYAEKVTFAWN